MQIKWTWFERNFDFDFPVEKMPDIRERLQGTHARLVSMLSSTAKSVAEQREQPESWSIKENVGHLGDLEPLWTGRIEDIVAGQKTMRQADLSNQPTFDANHNSKAMESLLSAFQAKRSSMLSLVDTLSLEQWSFTSNHPRLGTPMRVVDLCYFVAEHDDYHLARIRYLMDLPAT